MILSPKRAARLQAAVAETTLPAATGAVPGWLRGAVAGPQNLAAQSLEDVALAAGAAIGVLDAVVRRQERWAGAWRQRLGLRAAARAASRAGRVEDEAALRDAVLLTRPGDEVGPAGLLLLAWRRLASRPAAELLTERSIAAVLEEFGHVHDDETAGDLAGALRQLSVGARLAESLAGAFMVAEHHGFGRAFGCWLADALLAQRLGWAHAVPLMGVEAVPGIGPGRSHRSATSSSTAGVETESDRARSLLAAQARAALRAIDLAVMLERRADRLLAVAPKLRARGADAVVDRLLNTDALVVSRGDKTTGMSDRALRRLFDRLVELGAVRELSGRPAFRIYGL